MKIVSYLEGSVSWNAAWDELRPLVGAPHQLVMASLQAVFGFSEAGASPTAATQNLMTPYLRFGSTISEPQISINGVDFQADRVVASSSRTDLAEQALLQIVEYLQATFGFRQPPDERTYNYHSTIIFDPESDIEASFHAPWGPLLDKFKQAPEEDISSLSAFGMRFFPANPAITAESVFTIEKRVPCPPGENWWFSTGPFTTDFHEQLLVAISQCGHEIKSEMLQPTR